MREKGKERERERTYPDSNIAAKEGCGKSIFCFSWFGWFMMISLEH